MGKSRIFVISMRMGITGDTGELRNALAHDWSTYISQVAPDAFLMPFINMGAESVDRLAGFHINGVILSGGDDWGVFPLRDQTELELCRFARQNTIPLLGVCRGMQVLNHALGGRLPSQRDKRHIATSHAVEMHQGGETVPIKVNSYHSGLLFEGDLAQGVSATAYAADGSVEAVRINGLPMYGVMWHPEREREVRSHDKAMFSAVFGEK